MTKKKGSRRNELDELPTQLTQDIHVKRSSKILPDTVTFLVDEINDFF